MIVSYHIKVITIINFLYIVYDDMYTVLRYMQYTVIHYFSIVYWKISSKFDHFDVLMQKET